MAEKRRVVRRRAAASEASEASRGEVILLPTGRREPEADPYQYAYHITGPYKIGKTTLAIAGCEELVIQLDKPNLAYRIRETCPEVWSDVRGRKVGFRQVLGELERLARAGEFPYQRVVIDGAGELYHMCLAYICGKRGIEHPGGQDDYGASWNAVNSEFTEAINRLLRLQALAGCGLFFISHCEWKERPVARGSKETVSYLASDLSKGAGKVIDGKCDATFAYLYDGERRVLHVLGDEAVQAGSRIDGHFLTADGRRVRTIYMGDDSTTPEFAHEQFVRGFRNELEVADISELGAAPSSGEGATAKPRRRRRRKAST